MSLKRSKTRKRQARKKRDYAHCQEISDASQKLKEAQNALSDAEARGNWNDAKELNWKLTELTEEIVASKIADFKTISDRAREITDSP